MCTALEAADLATSVQDELDRLNAEHGEHNAPFGGWRNRAVENIAEREGLNPYALDRIIRAKPRSFEEYIASDANG